MNNRLPVCSVCICILSFLFLLPFPLRGQKLVIDKLKDLHIQTMLARDGKPFASIVIPADGRYQDEAKFIQQSIKEKSGATLPIVRDETAPAEMLKNTNVIALGNMATNSFIFKLYCQWYALLDPKYPGKGGYVVRSLHDPYGTGKNVILIGGSDNDGVKEASGKFCSLLPSGDPLSVGWLMEIRLGQGLIPPKIGIDGSGLDQVLTWQNKDRGGTKWGWNPISIVGMLYYMTGNREYMDCFKNLVKPDPENIPVAIRQFYSFVNLKRPLVEQVEEYTDHMVDCVWDLIEESPLFSDEDRLYVTRELLDHQYFRDPNHSIVNLSPSRHIGYSLFGIYTGSRYFAKYYPDPVWDRRLGNVRRSYYDFINKPSWGNDNLFFMPTYVQYIFDFFVLDGNEDFFTSGTAQKYMDGLLAIRTGEKTGDYYNAVNAFLLNMAAYTLKNNSYFWLTKELDFNSGIFRVGRSFWPSADVEIKPVNDIVGKILSFPLFTGQTDLPEGFQILSYRSGLEESDDYFLLDGHNGGGRSSYHVNSISKLRMFNGSYLLNGINNDIDITCNGLADSIVPVAATLRNSLTHSDLAYIRTEVPDMTNSVWQRNTLYLKNTGLLVADRIRAKKGSEFDIECSWTLQGKQEILSSSPGSLITREGTAITCAGPCEFRVERGSVIQEAFRVSLRKDAFFNIANLITYESNPAAVSKSLRQVDKNGFLLSADKSILITLDTFVTEGIRIIADFAAIENGKIFLADVKDFHIPGLVKAKAEKPLNILWDLKTGHLVIDASQACNLQYEMGYESGSLPVDRGRMIMEDLLPPSGLSARITSILKDLEGRNIQSADRGKITDKINWKSKWEIRSEGDAALMDMTENGEIWVAWDRESSHEIRKITQEGKVLSKINGQGKILSFKASQNREQASSFSLLAGFMDDTVRAYSSQGKILWKIKSEVDPVYKVGDKYVAPWFTDPEEVTGVYDILVDDIRGQGKTEIAIGRPVTLEFRSLDGSLIKRIPNQWGTNTDLKLLKRPGNGDYDRLLLAGKFITGFPGITAVSRDYENLSNDLFLGVKSGWTPMNGWGQQGLSQMAVEDLDNDGDPEVITTITGHWNELRVWKSEIRGPSRKSISTTKDQAMVVSGGTAGQGIPLRHDPPLWMKYFGPYIEGTWIIQGVLQRDPVDKMKDRFIRSLVVTDLNNDKYKEVIVGLKNGWMHTFDHSGKLLWQHRFDSSIRCIEPLQHEKGKLVIGLSDGKIHVTDRNGQILRTWQMNAPVERIIPAGKQIIAGSRNGVVAAFTL